MYTERLIAVFLVPRTVHTHSISALCARTLRSMSSHEVTQGTSSSFCTSNLHRRLGIEERPECKKAIKTKASGNLLHLKYCGNTSRQSSHTADIGSESAHRNWFLNLFSSRFFLGGFFEVDRASLHLFLCADTAKITHEARRPREASSKLW